MREAEPIYSELTRKRNCKDGLYVEACQERDYYRRLLKQAYHEIVSHDADSELAREIRRVLP